MTGNDGGLRRAELPDDPDPTSGEPEGDLPSSDEAREVLTLPVTARAAALTRLLRRTQRFVEWLSARRDEAVVEMRDAGVSYDEMARRLGISKSRAQQLTYKGSRAHAAPPSSDA